MNNPFDIIDERLGKIEDLILDLKHNPTEKLKTKTIFSLVKKPVIS